jgi:hypothetical protein
MSCLALGRLVWAGIKRRIQHGGRWATRKG